MSDQQGDDQITHRVIKAGFSAIDPKILARAKEIAEADVLPTDLKIIADDLQTVAVLALHTHENVEMLIQLMQQIGKAGSIKVDPPAKPTRRRRL